MNSETETEQPVPAPDHPNYSVPWKFIDNWIGVALLALIDVAVFIVILQISRTRLAQSSAVVFLEAAYILPVLLILAWRRIPLRYLGFGKFDWKTLGLGCGLLVASYAVILLFNALLVLFGVTTQGEEIVKIFGELNSPVWFLIAGTLIAPFVEEIFFRGFLFQGLRQRYGWVNAMLLSSAIFAIAHLDPVALVPTFILGSVLAYVYHRSNSVWPGITLHFMVNAFGVCGAYFAAHYQNLIQF